MQAVHVHRSHMQVAGVEGIMLPPTLSACITQAVYTILFQSNTGTPVSHRHTCLTCTWAAGELFSDAGSRICLHSSARYGHNLTWIETERYR